MDKINYKKLFELNRKIRIAIIGSRKFNDFDMFKKSIDPIFLKFSDKISNIVSGGAKGTDSMAEHFAESNKIDINIFKPDWEKYGNTAGIIRNNIIIKNSDLVIAFILGNSKGTTNSIDIAKKLKKELIIFDLDYILSKKK